MDDVEPEMMDVSRSNEAILKDAAKIVKSWPETVVAADGTEVLLQNPELGSMGQRTWHMIRNADTNRIDAVKASWIGNVIETLKNASVRVLDNKSGNHLYLRAYKNGDKHVVVVSPDGVIEGQNIESGRLITQYPATRTARMNNFAVEWERNSQGRLPGDPPLTPRASLIPDSKRGAFRGELSDQEASGVNKKDDAYLAAVERGDMAAAQKMVDEAAKKAGYEIEPMYHGTKERFTVFDRGMIQSRFPKSLGFHLTNSIGEAYHYATDLKRYDNATRNRNLEGLPKLEGSEAVIKAYVLAKNPLVIDTELPAASMEADINTGEIVGKLITAKRSGNPYDSVAITNKKNGNKNYILFSPEQIKSADAVTRDDAGEVIPLSERFDAGRGDIRYSVAEAEAGANEEAVAALEKMTAGEYRQHLRAKVKRLSGESLPEWGRKIFDLFTRPQMIKGMKDSDAGRRVLEVFSKVTDSTLFYRGRARSRMENAKNAVKLPQDRLWINANLADLYEGGGVDAVRAAVAKRAISEARRARIIEIAEASL